MSNGTRRHGPTKTDPELLIRTSWVNAELAYRQVKRGRANGNTCALWLRLHLQKYLFSLGCSLQLHCGKVVFLGVLLLSLCCVGLKTGHLETNVDELWVEEGGRLERELDYVKKTVGDGSGTTFELIIQTPKTGISLLNHESVMLHLKAVLAATKVKVNVDGLTWTFRDVCYTESFPSTEQSIVDMILEGILPCIVITPMDCFWEGAKLLGPDHPVRTGEIAGMPAYITWENLSPHRLLEKLESAQINIPVDAMRDVFQRAGITTAYQEKPCLNPMDPNCPKTAPNYNGSVPDIAGEFSKGCRGFATKYMNWEQDLIFGGVKKNRTGHIVRVEAFQSILQLMADKDLYEYYEQHQKVTGIDWTQQKAAQVLEAFQRKFSQVINDFGNETNRDYLHGFSYTSLMDLMKDFSTISVIRLVLGCIFMFAYACVSLLRWNDAVNSQCGIGMAGVTLVCLSVAAGLGVCSVLGISFNASTTQIIPFFALGLGVDDMFLIAHTFFENADTVDPNDLTGEVLKKTGVTVLLTSISNVLAFFTAAIIPIPALRAFTLQAAILVLFNLGSILLVFPAIVSLDLVRRDDKRIDVLCCLQSSSSNDVIELQSHSHSHSHSHGDDGDSRGHRRDHSDLQREPSPPPPYSAAPGSTPPCYDTVARSDLSGVVTSLASNDGVFVRRGDSNLTPTCPSTTSSQQCLTPENKFTCKDRCGQAHRECLTWTLTCLAARVYAPFLQRPFVKITVLVTFLILLILGAWGTAQVKDGLDLTDLVPRDTPEFSFLEAQSKYFGFYSINIITQGNFDYANNQQLLYQYHSAFQTVKKIVRREDDSLPAFWLNLFRQWLRDLQRSFDRDYHKNLITPEGWKRNASEETILAYKLLIQTGSVDNPINRDQINHVRLVDNNGIINPPAFYNYLTAWTSNDALAYSASMANFHPLPKEWLHDATDYNFEIHKSQHLVYAQMPFYLTNLSTTEDVISVIKEIRSISERYQEKGVPNFPSGVPFTYYEQYINLRFYLMLSILCVLGVTFVVLTVILMNPWLAFIVVVVLAMIVIELFGFMGLAGIKLSAVPAVILIMTVGIGVEFTLHLSVGFITAIGSRNRRMAIALEHTMAPVIHGAISTFLGILMLVGTEFDFIIKYFFNVLAILIIIGLFNGLMLLPVILSIFGPPGEVIPKDNGDCLEMPTPEPSPQMDRRYSSGRSHHHRSRRIYPRVNADISLSTISEEPTQYSSHEIIVKPEVVVETTMLPGMCNDSSHHMQRRESSSRPSANVASSNGGTSAYNSDSCRNSISSSGSSSPTMPSPHITRVKATATVKVEVHTPIPGSMNQEHVYKSKRRKNRDCGDSHSSSKSDVNRRQSSQERETTNSSGGHHHRHSSRRSGSSRRSNRVHHSGSDGYGDSHSRRSSTRHHHHEERDDDTDYSTEQNFSEA